MNRTVFYLLLFLLASTLWKCNEVDSFGSEFFDDGRQNAKTLTFTNFDFQTVDLERLLMYREDSLTGHYVGPEQFILLGDYEEPLAGKSSALWTAQYVNIDRVEFDPDQQYVVDSAVLTLSYDTAFGFVGEEPSTFDVRVYEVSEALDAQRYFSDDVIAKNSIPIGQLTNVQFQPKTPLQSIEDDDTTELSPRLNIPIDPGFAARFIGLDTVVQDSTDLFLETFKGLTVEATRITGNGGFVRFVIPRIQSNLNIYYRPIDSTENALFRLSPNQFFRGLPTGRQYSNFNHFDYDVVQAPEGRFVLQNLGAAIPKLTIHDDVAFDTIDVVDAFLEMYVDNAILEERGSAYPRVDQLVPSLPRDGSTLFFDEVPDADPYSQLGALAGINIQTVDTSDVRDVQLFRIRFTRELWNMIEDPARPRDIYFVDPEMWTFPGRTVLHDKNDAEYPMVLRIVYTPKP